jgi:hypothetical protein
MSAPIVGMQGVYVCITDKVNTTPAKTQAEKDGAGTYFLQQSTRSLGQGLSQSIIDNAKLVDNRAEFY